MHKEIEIKIPIKDEAESYNIMRKIKDYGGAYCGYIRKCDTYYKLDDKNLRLRKELSSNIETTIVTTKNKKIEDGVEINDEREVNQLDFNTAKALIEFLGYKEIGYKEKSVYSYKINVSEDHTIIQINLELVHISGLIYAELECIDNHDADQVIRSFKSILNNLGLDYENRDSRPWFEILKEEVKR